MSESEPENFQAEPEKLGWVAYRSNYMYNFWPGNRWKGLVLQIQGQHGTADEQGK